MITRFLFFILFAILVYSFLNYYFLKKKYSVISLKNIPGIVIKLFFTIIILTPIVSTIFSRAKISNPFFVLIISYAGYSWLAFLFLFLVVHGLADLILFILYKIGLKKTKIKCAIVFFSTVIICIIILFYGYFEAEHIQIKNIEIRTNNENLNKNNLKIVQISDVHFSPLIGYKTALKIKQIIKKINPDILVLTGDFLDPGVKDKLKIYDIFQSIKVKYGKYAVTGNHEFYAGINKSIEFIKNSGFILLRNKAVTIAGLINIVGIDDKTRKRFESKNIISEFSVLKNIKNKYYTILLKHQPIIQPALLKYFDLQLSGHTHGGQIFPFTFLVKLRYKYIKGMYELPYNTRLYVNPGTGTWGPTIRFFSPPEITIINLK